MFIRLYHSYDEDVCLFHIVDTDFEDVVPSIAMDKETGSAWEAICLVYEKRGLPVASNLVMAFCWYSNLHRTYRPDIIKISEQYNKLHAKYKTEIDKYLLLLQ
jgi:hypothetical protein